MRSLTKKKIFLLLTAGASLALLRSPKGYFKVVSDLPKEWRKIKHDYLRNCIREFYNDRLIDFKEQADGSCHIILSDIGKRKVLKMNIDTMVVKRPGFWDGKWRVVIFDIPERNKNARNALRQKLKDLGFYDWQKSVFIYPYSCLSEIEFLIEFFKIRHYVRYFEAAFVINEAELKLHFEDII